MCALEHFLGFVCPGCGLTRSVIALLSGHFAESVAWHPMGILIVLWALNFFLHRRTRLWRGWFKKFELSIFGRKIVSHAVLSGFFVPWIVQFFI